jgi:hypothetical protein
MVKVPSGDLLATVGTHTTPICPQFLKYVSGQYGISHLGAPLLHLSYRI